MIINCQVKQLGKKRAVIEEFPLKLEINNKQAISLTELIEYVVKREVSNHNKKCDTPEIFPTLTSEEIYNKAETFGKVDFGDLYNNTKANFDKAINTALTAFEDGLFYLFVDDKKIESLEEQIQLKNNSQLMFLKLAMLTGGWF